MVQPNLNLDGEWIEKSVSKVLWFMRFRESFSADDIHGVVDEPLHPNKYGALMHALKPHLELVGYTRSTRAGRNGSLLRLWRVKT